MHPEPTSAYRRVVAALERKGSKRSGDDWQCPAHSDQNPSLSVRRCHGGVLIFCHAHCRTEEVVDGLGLTMKDLFDEPPAAEARSTGASPTIAAAYPYHDHDGQLLYEVVRFDPKRFRHRRPNGSGGWIWSLGETRRVLYRLPEVLAAVGAGDTIWIAEGEKDAEALRSVNLVATCSPGVGKWRGEFTQTLAGAQVVVVQDRDDPGRDHGARLSADLRAAGCTVRVVEARTGKDAHDHFAAGNCVKDFVGIEPDSSTAKLRQIDLSGGTSVGRVESHTTDLGNARRFVIQHGRDVRYCADDKTWRLWDGRRWRSDDTNLAMHLAKTTALSIYEESVQVRTPGQVDLARWAMRSEAATRLRALLELAESDLEVAARSSDFDSRPHLLNVANGTLDLRTLALRPHRRDDLLSRLAPVEYHEEAHSQLWEDVLEHALPDPEVRRFLQKAGGYTLTGETRQDVLFLLHGPTRTGKGTVQQAIASALGDYSQTAGLHDMAEPDRSAPGPRPEIVELKGARMVSIYETSRKLRLDAALIKTLTGSDPIRARGLYRDPVEFLPQHVLWIGTNHRPHLPGDDDAVWERIREIPFVKHVPEERRDPGVRARLSNPAESGSAILRWAVKGLELFREEGLRPPEIVRRATSDYRSEMDRVGGFLKDHCQFDPEGWTQSSELQSRYSSWCDEEDIRCLSRKEFHDRLRSMGCTPERRNVGRGWRGVELLVKIGDGP